MSTIAARLIALALAVPMLSNAARAQQSEVQRCLSLPQDAEASLVEYCQGIRAASGIGMPQNRAAAFQHYLKAAEMGYAQAQATVGAAYRRGWQVRPDLRLAAQWYEKAAAQGSAPAELDLGLMYAQGMGVAKDPARARRLIEAAARQGLPQARQALERLGDNGVTAVPGLHHWNQAVAHYRAREHASAAKLAAQAARAGNPTATYEMGYLYENGDGVPKDMAEAARWYMKGAAMREPAAEAAVGQLYENGRGVRDDWIEAAKWFRKSAEQGNAKGELRLGRAYQYGIGVPLDLGQAASWYDKAAAQGNGQAAYFAKYIRDNHGFDGSSYSVQEQAVMAPYRSQPWALRQPPTGRVFRSTADRMSYFQGWAKAAAAYEDCMSRHFGALPGTTFQGPAPVPPG
jgi:TPR repeat protein